MELAEMKEENARLRGIISEVEKDYETLQVHLATLMQRNTQFQYSPQTQQLVRN